MTAIAMQPDMTAIKQRQQATWASGDYHMIGTQILLVSEMLIEALDIHSTESVLDVATGSGNAAMAAARRGCTVVGIDYVPSLLDRARRRTEGRRPQRRLHRGRRRGAAVRRRELRRRHLRLRRDVRARPGPDRERARPGHPAGRPDRPRRAHAERVHRSAVQDERPARRTAGRARLAGPVGHRGSTARAVRRRHRRDQRREADVRLPLHVAGRLCRLLAPVLRSDDEDVRGRRRSRVGRPSRPTCSP